MSKKKGNANITEDIKKVKYIFLKSGPGHGFGYVIGDVAELSDEAAKYLIENQIVERV